MYHDHGKFVQPEDPDAKIWRYMDFTKFVWMLEKNALHFTRGDRFDDIFEGAIPKPNVAQMRNRVTSIGATTDAAGMDPVAFVVQLCEGMRGRVAINSWHLNEHESAAMWNVYLKSNEGIAVRSTVRRLRESLSNDPQTMAWVGVVQYVDYEHTPIPLGNLLTMFLYKRKSFEHERELRALVARARVADDGVTQMLTDEAFEESGADIAVNVAELVVSVFVAPTSPPWFEELIRSVLRRYGLDRPVVRSDLDASPLY
jgi:hypothetical protein